MEHFHQIQQLAAQQQQQAVQQQQQHHVVVQQNQQQAHQNHTNISSGVDTQHLFTYKMTSSFPNPSTTTAISNAPGTASYDYRLNMAQAVAAAVPGSQWWYSATNQGQIETHTGAQLQQQQHQQQQQYHNHQQQQNIHAAMKQNTIIRNSKIDTKPRGRMTAYAYFVQTCREEHKKKHPDETVIFAEFSKKCAERWKEMVDKEKQRFHDLAEKDKQRYEMEMQNYVPPKGSNRGKKRKQIKDPNAPKRSLSAFFWFCNDERNKVKALNPEYGVGDIAKELGRKWSDVDSEVKQKYELMAEKDKARYEREMTEYKTSAKIPMSAPSMQAQVQAAQKAALLAATQQQQHHQQLSKQQQHHEEHEDDGYGDGDENQ